MLEHFIWLQPDTTLQNQEKTDETRFIVTSSVGVTAKPCLLQQVKRIRASAKRQTWTFVQLLPTFYLRSTETPCWKCYLESGAQPTLLCNITYDLISLICLSTRHFKLWLGQPIFRPKDSKFWLYNVQIWLYFDLYIFCVRNCKINQLYVLRLIQKCIHAL